MKSTSIWTSFTVLGLGLALALGLYTGCEDTPSDEGINNYFDNNPYQSDARPDVAETPTADLSIDPSISSAQTDQLINFEAGGGTAPFAWSVGTPAYGTITAQANTRYAIYRHSGTTNNINSVVVTDASGASAIASVN